tara:strand:- start:4075 stop:5262 length:1188 start_codon:yes stop_codon:yes gene_type:complete
MIVPIALIPFHDWRKIQIEGFRTRDAHFIEEFSKNQDRIKIIINRPTTLAEILGKRKLGLIKGKKIISKGSFRLYEIEHNLYLIDYVSNDVFGQIRNGYSWFFHKYRDASYKSFIEQVFGYLKVTNDVVLFSQNIFASGLFEKLNSKIKVFDAWDNFNKFHVYEKVKEQIYQAYQNLSVSADYWTTNSVENLDDFTLEFKPKNIKLISNGVDLRRFVQDDDNNKQLQDLKGIKRPIIGFGGKISQLIDVELLNKTMRGMPTVSFVFVGQILDKNVYGKIDKLPNFYYLGDKHYDDYPNYVKNFDVCIVPYVIEKSQKSGANTIKVYEYLATGKKIIGTPSNGLEYLSEYVYLVNNEDEFIGELQDIENKKPRIELADYSWKRKVHDILKIISPKN